jgi:hypothetical protein
VRAVKKKRGKKHSFLSGATDYEMWAQSDFVRPATAGVFTTGWMDGWMVSFPLPLESKQYAGYLQNNVFSCISIVHDPISYGELLASPRDLWWPLAFCSVCLKTPMMDSS